MLGYSQPRICIVILKTSLVWTCREKHGRIGKVKDVEIEGKGKQGRRKKACNDAISEDLLLWKKSDVLPAD